MNRTGEPEINELTGITRAMILWARKFSPMTR
jgi:hypothetical protein